MVIVKVVSGPRKGQVNLSEMKPKDLFVLAREGWRWELDYSTILDGEVTSWIIQDISCKVISCLIGGREIILQLPGEPDQKWSGEFSKRLVGEIEDAVVYSGYSVTIIEDSEESLIISGKVLEGKSLH